MVFIDIFHTLVDMIKLHSVWYQYGLKKCNWVNSAETLYCVKHIEQMDVHICFSNSIPELKYVNHVNVILVCQKIYSIFYVHLCCIVLYCIFPQEVYMSTDWGTNMCVVWFNLWFQGWNPKMYSFSTLFSFSEDFFFFK